MGRTQLASALILALAVWSAGENSARAGWFTSLVRETAEVGSEAAGRAGRSVELAPLKSAASYLDNLNTAPKDALAAHATLEGHWQFVNREGQTFTVGTPDEMKRVLPTLMPDASATGDKRMTLYLSEDSVFANKAALTELPSDANLNVVIDKVAYPIARSGKGADIVVKAKLTPNLTMELRDQAAFEETAFLLSRPLNKSNIRTVAFDTGATASMSSAPKLDSVTKVPLVDQLDPAQIGTGLRPLRGQTVLVTGRVEGGNLIVAPASGGEMGVPIDRILAAARDNDVNLVILQSDSSRQAGGRNWLWQKIKIGGLDAATDTATFGDFLDALADRRGGFLLNANSDGASRVRIAAIPDVGSAGLSNDTSNVIVELVSHVTGEVVTNAVSIEARDRNTQTERDIRLIPWLPASVQIIYLAGVVCGIAGLATARKWWSALLRAVGLRKSTATPRIHWRIASGTIFVLVFLPVVGFLAFTVQAIHQLILLVLAPFRWIRRRVLLKQV
ncbi:hypothetical protein [Hyphomicrobium sp.]|jgi:hypothetical protein|uniref:hypothetical protein n=1 Tax=Hyphomicrobium sp. TaxID=82 RepID=UPI003565B3DC